MTPSDSPGVVRVYPPDTVLSSSSLIFLGMRNPDLPDHAEGLAVDAQRDTGGTYVSMNGGQPWSSYSGYADWHVRACLIYPHAVEEATESHSPPGALLQVDRNPFCETVLIQYRLPSPADVNLNVYDSRGAFVAVLVDGSQGAGVSRVRWFAGAQPDGVYFCRLQVGDFVEALEVIKLE